MDAAAGARLRLLLTVRRAPQWGLVAFVTLAVWFGPPVLFTVNLVALGVFILVRGHQWQRLWLATILVAMLVVAGLVSGMVLLFE